MDLKQPVHVTKIHVDGLDRTKDDVIRKIVKRLFQSTTLEELIQNIKTCKYQLHSLNAFSKIQCEVDVDKDPDHGPDDLEITLIARENSRFSGSINTAFGSRNDCQLLIHGKTPNVFGAGEHVLFEWSYGGRDTLGLNLTFHKPLKPWSLYSPNFSTTLFGLSTDLPKTGFIQTERGVLAGLSINSSDNWAHSIKLINSWRTASTREDRYPRELREQCKHDLKASLVHSHLYDTLDNRVLPTTGTLLRFSQEYSGFNGDVNFWKHEFECQHNFKVFKRISAQLTFNGGLIKMKDTNQSSPFDRFYLGGPLSVRGFQTFGIGSKRGDFAMGGNAFWAAGAHLYTPFPFDHWMGRLREQLKAHFFVTAGRLEDAIPQMSSFKEFANIFQDKVRLSAGIGAVFNFHNFVRLELNYCWPVSAQLSDRREGGLRFGLGINYL